MTRTAPNTPLLLRALNWLADFDGAYRQRRQLEEMPQERLDDMGLDRAAADAVFYRGWGSRRADRSAVVRLTAARLR